MTSFDIYCFFNAAEMEAIFHAVVLVFGAGDDFETLLKLVALMGLFIAVCYGFLRARAEEAGVYLLAIALFYGGLFLPRVTVNIQDMSGMGGAVRTVDNIPLGLAFFASFTSKIGYWLTDRFETMFSLPDPSLNFSQHGLMAGARTLRLSQTANLPDPLMLQDFTTVHADRKLSM